MSRFGPKFRAALKRTVNRALKPAVARVITRQEWRKLAARRKGITGNKAAPCAFVPRSQYRPYRYIVRSASFEHRASGQ